MPPMGPAGGKGGPPTARDAAPFKFVPTRPLLTPKEREELRAEIQRAKDLRIARARVSGASFNEYVLRNEGRTLSEITNAPAHEELHRLIDKNPQLVLWAHVEFGKALALDTPIPTPGGWKTMGDLRVGDSVFGSSGQPCKVTEATPVMHDHRVYRVRFDDGDTLIADAEHRWIAKTMDDAVRQARGGKASQAHAGDGDPCACGCGLRAKRGHRFVHNHHGRAQVGPDGWRVVTTEEMLAAGVTRVSGAKRKDGTKYDQYLWRIPLPEPVQYPEQALAVHPYVLGAWLGDGDSAGPTLTMHEDDREIGDLCSQLENRPPSMRPIRGTPHILSVSLGLPPRARGARHRDGLRARLRGLGVLNDKHIPAAYLTGSVEQRRDLLAGLLDTDGTVSAKGSVSFTNMNRRLAEDVLELARSLAFKATIHESPATLNGRVVGTAYEVTFTPKVPVFKLRRKLARQRLGTPTGRTSYKSVVAIERVESVPVRCIAVDSPNHSYLAGRGYAVTHNSAQVSVGRALYELGRNPNLRIAIVSETDDKAKKLLRGIKKYIQESPQLREVFPHMRRSRKEGDQWNAHAITVKRETFARDPSIQVVGVGGSIIGSRVDFLVLDDVLSHRTSLTKGAREKLYAWYASNCAGRMTEDGRIIAVGTPWHKCLLPTTQVVTAAGMKPASEVTADDLLLVGPDRWEKPVAMASKDIDKDVVVLDVMGIGNAVELTDNHRVPTTAGLKFAGDLQAGDVLYLDRTPLFTEDSARAEVLTREPKADLRIRAAAPAWSARTVKPMTKSKISKEELEADIAEGLTYAQISKKRGYSGRRNHIGYLVRRLGVEPRHQEFDAPNDFTATTAWWKLAGFWLAEGDFHDTSKGGVRFTFGFSEEEKGFANEAAEAAREALGVPVRVYPVPHGTRVSFQCTRAAKWLRENLGAGARNKRLATWVERVPFSFAQPFLLSYWKGDGSTTALKAGRFSTSSISLAYGLQRWIANLGYPSLVFSGESNGKGFGPAGLTHYEVRCAIPVAAAFGIPVTFKRRRPTLVRVEGDRILFPIRRVARRRYSGPVYDFQTSTGWFAATNVVVHNSDLMHTLAKTEGWVQRKFPVLDPKTRLPTWPQAWSLTRIEKARIRLGPLEAARQLDCEPWDESTNRFQEGWITRALDEGNGLGMVKAWADLFDDGLLEHEQVLPDGAYTVTGVDVGASMRATGGLTVLTTILIYPSGVKQILCIEAGRWTAPMILQRCYEHHARFRSTIFVESNGAQKFLLDFAERDAHNQLLREPPPILPHNTGANKNDPTFGVESIGVEMFQGRWWLPNDGGVMSAELAELVAAMRSYSPDVHTSDYLMSLWIASQGARMLGRSMHTDGHSKVRTRVFAPIDRENEYGL